MPVSTMEQAKIEVKKRGNTTFKFIMKRTTTSSNPISLSLSLSLFLCPVYFYPYL
ncbi:uncharacterized protein BO96DRAFT_54613 [Aspergillus niger CBS 101883]|uniref:uncharacterized protein n=1 Tax=Aspergillus lacticoffeatus (strain CBS 101883) TaxID=1450533 RepID=UPI000D7F9D5B|nr:uncharacterized protein BO96DRAFT_54613 [Aspergillus niger CBS 101883]PYH56283.1 hypothetical protein BO96DRAFT_54613 [Aspergillus niger CBS 101883]